MIPVLSFIWKCPICGLEDQDRNFIVDHINETNLMLKQPIKSGSAVKIINRYPKNTFSVARVGDWYYNEHHYRVYYLDRFLLYKDSDHYCDQDNVGEVVNEYDILDKSETGFTFDQALCHKKDDLDLILNELIYGNTSCNKNK